MKYFFTLIIIFFLLIQSSYILSLDYQNKQTFKTSNVEDLEKEIFMRPFYNFVFEIRGGYNIVLGNYEKYFDHSPLGIIYFVLNPKLIDNFLCEMEIGYNRLYFTNTCVGWST